jgi:riboflavin-specific deaminase-like protein
MQPLMAAVADESPDQAAAWALLLALARRASEGRPVTHDVGLRATEDGALEEGTRAPLIVARPSTDRGWSWPDGAAARPALQQLFDLYVPLCMGAGRESFAVAHLAQTLDGRIAIASGKSRYISGKESLVHAHRLRALFDVVLVGQRTIREDDPQLTTRLCEGPSPVRVVIDPERRLGRDYRVFQGAPGATLLFCSREAARANPSHGDAEVVGIEATGGALPVQAILAELRSRGLGRVFVEGGGLTVSRFLAAGALGRLHLTVAPLVFGSGRPSLTLPEIQELSEARALHFRHFSLGPDVLFDCTVAA